MTQTIRQFSQMKINTKQSFVGDKIYIESLLDKEITVQAFKITDSTKKPGTDCLNLQIFHEEKQKVLFTGSTFLIDQIKQVGPEDFPFMATIIRVNRHFEFK